MMSTDPIAVVEALRADGRSIAAACRAAGISASTYYRRRKEATVRIEDVHPPMIRFARADPLLASELTDSVVHRIAGPPPASRAHTAAARPLRLRPSLAHQGLSERARLLLRIAVVAGALALLGSAASAALTAMAPNDASRLAEAVAVFLA
ncbi:MAG: hypothetical protein KJS97_14040 [Alphaproteobacteria bacterium]|nr:hypothetical protein [Alphaproteobacteria bacterium]